jgi:hypothetical protein
MLGIPIKIWWFKSISPAQRIICGNSLIVKYLIIQSRDGGSNPFFLL